MGDITAAAADVAVVNHFNGLPPDGAERAIDRALGGAIARAAARGILLGSFGATRFFPASRAHLAVGAVLVISLGDPERFHLKRLPEIGTALVEAMAGSQLPEAATIVHGAGSAGLDARQAVLAFVRGVVTARACVPGGDGLRSLIFVEQDGQRLRQMRTALQRGDFRPQELWIDRGPVMSASVPAVTEAPAHDSGATRLAIAPHLRLGITRSGPDLKVTRIGDGALDACHEWPYPIDLATRILRRLQDEVVSGPDARSRAAAMLSVGGQLRKAFLDAAAVPLDRGGTGDLPLVLRLDRSTVQMPWELLHDGAGFLSRTGIVARQMESGMVGRTAPQVEDDDGKTNVLVVGDPASDLPQARVEAASVARALGRLRGVRVQALIDGVTYSDLSRALDATRFDVVHYAGHATHDPLRGTALLLRDSPMAADDLTTRRFLPWLFFVNACYSAATGRRTEMLIGTVPTLVSGLLSAGVRAFVGANWAVGDRAATTFAIAFYRSLLQGRTVGEAVRVGRASVADQHGEGEPAWAAYSLYGPPWLTMS